MGRKNGFREGDFARLHLKDFDVVKYGIFSKGGFYEIGLDNLKKIELYGEGINKFKPSGISRNDFTKEFSNIYKNLVQKTNSFDSLESLFFLSDRYKFDKKLEMLKTKTRLESFDCFSEKITFPQSAYFVIQKNELHTEKQYLPVISSGAILSESSLKGFLIDNKLINSEYFFIKNVPINGNKNLKEIIETLGRNSPIYLDMKISFEK